jgi:hypothetical protein
MSCLYPKLFGCCSKQVLCPNCTLLIPPDDFRGKEHRPQFKDSLQFKLASTSYKQLRKENNFSYLSNGEDLSEETMQYISRDWKD